MIIRNFGLNRNGRTLLACSTEKSFTNFKGSPEFSTQSEIALPVCLFPSVSRLSLVSTVLGVQSSLLYMDQPNRIRVFLGEYLVRQPRFGAQIAYPLLKTRNATKTNISFRFLLHANVTNKYAFSVLKFEKQRACNRIHYTNAVHYPYRRHMFYCA